MEPSQSSQSFESGSQKRETRISKNDLYMALALWMEMFPSGDNANGVQPKAKKVGVVFVLPNNRVLTADSSRDGVHGIARVVVKHNNKLEGCAVFVSRKPCSVCTKLLVQAKVSRIFCLPIEPESIDAESESERVDNLFKANSLGLSVFVPCIEDKVLAHEKRYLPTETSDADNYHEMLNNKWWNEDWVERAGERFHNCLKNELRSQVRKDFMALMKWLAGIASPLEDTKLGFRKVRYDEKDDKLTADSDEYDDTKMAKVMIVFAKMLARQTDDPKTGVGAVIVKEREVMALGWNGYPSKALYGEYPRASDDDSAREKKYPFVIHAEQNAIMLRNTTDLSGGVLFVTKTPCNECAPLLKLSGITTVVVGDAIGKSRGGQLSYDLIKEYIKNGVFTCYEMTRV